MTSFPKTGPGFSESGSPRSAAADLPNTVVSTVAAHGDTTGVADTAMINGKIAALSATGGGILRLAATAGSQFYTTGLTHASGVTLDLGGCTLNLAAGAVLDAITVPTGTFDAWVQNGTINLSGLAQAGVRFTSTTTAGIARCGALGPLHVTNGAAGSINSMGVIATSDSVGTHPCDVLIDRVTIDNTSIGIDVRQCDGAKITRCSILNTLSFWGISDHGCTNALIAENRVNNCHTQGIVTYVDGTVPTESTAQPSIGSCVIGNLIQNCGNPTLGNLGWGINPSARSRTFTVSGNIIRGCYQGGITADVPVTPSTGLTTTVNGAGQVFPTATFNVASSVGFDVPGVLSIPGVTGSVAYTGIGAGTFTGCTGGTGTATNSATVQPLPLINQITDGTISGNVIDGFSGGQITLHLVSGASGSTLLNFTYNGPSFNVPTGVVYTTAAVNFGDSAGTIQTKLNAATGPTGQALPANALAVAGGPFGTSDLTITGNAVSISQLNNLGHQDTTLVCQFIPGNASGQTTWSNAINTNYAQGLSIEGNIITGSFAAGTNVFGANITVSGNTFRGCKTGVNLSCLIGDASLPSRGGHAVGPNTYNSCTTNVNQSPQYRSDGVWFPTLNTGPDIYTGPNILRSGAFYVTPSPGLDTTLVIVSNTCYAEPFPVANPFGIVTATMGAEVTSAGTAGSVVRLGIYADNGTGFPGQLMYDLGTIDGTSATVQTRPFAKTLLPGLYWIVLAGQGAPATQPTMRARAGQNPLVPMFASSTGNFAAITFTSISGALPSTLSGPSAAGTAPKIMVGT